MGDFGFSRLVWNLNGNEAGGSWNVQWFMGKTGEDEVGIALNMGTGIALAVCAAHE